MKPKITIYTTMWCGFCKMAKHYLTVKGFSYTEKDVEQDAQAAKEAVEKSGQRGVPIIDIDGTIILGFNRPMIDHVLKIQ